MQSFGAADGVWEETRWRRQQARGPLDPSERDDIITSLDPDATTR